MTIIYSEDYLVRTCVGCSHLIGMGRRSCGTMEVGTMKVTGQMERSRLNVIPYRTPAREKQYVTHFYPTRPEATLPQWHALCDATPG